MGIEGTGVLTRIGFQNPLKRWTRAMQNAAVLSDGQVAAMNAQMRVMRDQIDTLTAEAQAELLTRAWGGDGIQRPDQCDWAERPAAWSVPMRPRAHVQVTSPLDMIGGAKLFHDAETADMSVRQDPVHHADPGARFGLILDVYRFDGSFLSLVQDVPEAGLKGLTLNHYFTVQMQIQQERPLEVYARLNVQHGPNHEQLVQQFQFDGETAVAEFDLAYSKISEKRLEKAWVDLIFDNPSMNRVAIWDLALLRAPRADI